MEYDLEAMDFDPNEKLLFNAFMWNHTQEGHDYWVDVYATTRLIKDLPPEPAAKYQAMLDQYHAQNRPAVGVLHQHDGSSNAPIPAGTDHAASPMFICALTLIHGPGDIEDFFTIHETAPEAMDEYRRARELPNLHCACTASIITATEPHWWRGENFLTGPRTNKHRAAEGKALCVLIESMTGVDEAEAQAADVITQILHFCTASGIEPDGIMKTAKMNFDAETNGE